MNEEIFRKKSIERAKSPESLDDYIRVSNPGVWLLLVSIIALLIGACIWGIFGRIESTIPVTIFVKDGKAVCDVDFDDISLVKTGTKVKFENTEAEIKNIGERTEICYTCELSPDVDLPDGFYEGKAIIKSYSPISFVFN